MKNLFISIAFTTVTMLAFTSCNHDNEPQPIHRTTHIHQPVQTHKHVDVDSVVTNEHKDKIVKTRRVIDEAETVNYTTINSNKNKNGFVEGVGAGMHQDMTIKDKNSNEVTPITDSDVLLDQEGVGEGLHEEVNYNVTYADRVNEVMFKALILDKAQIANVFYTTIEHGKVNITINYSDGTTEQENDVKHYEYAGYTDFEVKGEFYRVNN
ncbi:hypothetical protein [Flammeovirga sp. SubArs3]|uniref:hypothetical protein n=1 Tax=Flammeovirga sp. SubArs3 TaxID=2995316 RepID=UPI00248D3639|nr:hypothetical protein [Flammeovirga sp. SubArs3]